MDISNMVNQFAGEMGQTDTPGDYRKMAYCTVPFAVSRSRHASSFRTAAAVSLNALFLSPVPASARRMRL
nr:MAG TPA: hypothetical protein [Caudoviricetes sp.]